MRERARTREPARTSERARTPAPTRPAEGLAAGVLEDIRAGEAAPIVAMRLLREAETPEAALAALRRAAALEGMADRVRDVAALIARHPSAWGTVRSLAGGIEHRAVRGDAIAHWAQLFDSLVRVSPEGSVALYSLGSRQLLDAATSEIVALLERWGLLEDRPAILDVGCGIGRLEAALASRVASLCGLDIAPAMIDEARRRCAHLANVRFEPCSGIDLRGTASESVDLVTLIDTLPYVFLAGEALVGPLVAEAARVLRPRGSILVLNASYRCDADQDLADLDRFASDAGLNFLRAEWRPFDGWDAPAFQLVKR